MGRRFKEVLDAWQKRGGQFVSFSQIEAAEAYKRQMANALDWPEFANLKFPRDEGVCAAFVRRWISLRLQGFEGKALIDWFEVMDNMALIRYEQTHVGFRTRSNFELVDSKHGGRKGTDCSPIFPWHFTIDWLTHRITTHPGLYKHVFSTSTGAHVVGFDSRNDIYFVDANFGQFWIPSGEQNFFVGWYSDFWECNLFVDGSSYSTDYNGSSSNRQMDLLQFA